MAQNNLTQKQILDAISLEYSLSQKRSQSEVFETKFNFGKCKICNSEATGIHYGVCSCEGCKGFFKRSLIKHKNYTCKGNQNCIIHPKDTRKCKYCRWMTCLKAGMSLSHVRVGRIPNYMKEMVPKNEHMHKNSSIIRKNKFCLLIKYMRKHEKLDQQFFTQSTKFLPKNLYTEKYLNCSHQNQLIVLSTLRDKAYQIYLEQTQEFKEHEIKARNLILNNYKPIKVEKGSYLALELKKRDKKEMEKHASSMFKFVEQLPGFQKITKNDIQIILKRVFCSVFAIRTVNLFIENEFYYMYDDIPMTSDIFAFITSQKIRDIHFKFYKIIQMLNLTEQEIALSVPLIFLMLNQNLENLEIIQELREYYIRALFFQFSLSNRSQKFIFQFFQIISVTPVIDKLCQELEYGNEVNF
uniref:Nuclear receptor n=1 Tax=Brachionus koreanus TaxID=1199090 RepID=A0A221CB84_9BILA|nr:nuclear receptor [Brachionus koreanus]